MKYRAYIFAHKTIVDLISIQCSSKYLIVTTSLVTLLLSNRFMLYNKCLEYTESAEQNQSVSEAKEATRIFKVRDDPRGRYTISIIHRARESQRGVRF